MAAKWFTLFDARQPGGENNYASDSMIQPNEAAETLNVRWDEAGILQTRKGKQAYGSSTSGIASAAIRGMFRGYSNLSGNSAGDDDSDSQESKLQLLCQNGKLYRGDDSDGSGTEITYDDGAGNHDVSVAAGTSQMRAVQWKGSRVYLAFGSGCNCLRYALNTELTGGSTNGAHLLGIGAGTPGTPTAAQATAAGTSTAGAFACACAYIVGPGEDYEEFAEGPIGARDDGTIADTAKKYKITPAALGNHLFARQVHVYATDGGQASGAAALLAPMYYVGTTGAAAVFTWSDSDYDYSKPAPSTLDTNTIPDQNVRLLEVHNERLWCTTEAHPDRLYYSNIGKPDECPTLNWFAVPDQATGLKSFKGELVIFTSSEIYVMRGWSPEDFEATIELAIPNRGCVSPDTVHAVDTRYGRWLFFATTEGIWAFDGHTTHFVGEKVRGTWDNIDPDNLSNLRAITQGHRYRIAYQDDNETGSYNNKELVYDSRYHTWSTNSGLNIGCYAHWFGAADSDEMYYGESSTNGMAYKMDIGTDTMEWIYRTGYQAIGGWEMQKVIKAVQIMATADTFPITITLKYDGGDHEETFTIPTAPINPGEKEGFEFESLGDNTYLVHGPRQGKRCRTVGVRFYANNSINHGILNFKVLAEVDPWRYQYGR